LYDIILLYATTRTYGRPSLVRRGRACAAALAPPPLPFVAPCSIILFKHVDLPPGSSRDSVAHERRNGRTEALC
jgi:hypothetical protein